MSNFTIFDLTLQGGSNEDFEKYEPSDLHIGARLRADMPHTMKYDFYLYDEQLTLIGSLSHALQQDAISYRHGRLKATLKTRLVWMAGRYRLLMACPQSDKAKYSTWVVEFTLDDDLQLAVEGERVCRGPGLESTLTRYFTREDVLLWERFTNLPGVLPMKQWIIQRRLLEWLNEEQAARGGAQLKDCNNYLCVAPTMTYATQTAFFFKHIAFRFFKHQVVRCDELYNPLNVADPYAELFRRFPLHEDKDLFEMVGDINERRFTTVIKVGELLSDEGQRVWQHLRSHILANGDPHQGVLIYGTKEEIGVLLDEDPDMLRYFRESTYATLPPYTAAEMVHFFVEQTKGMGLSLSHDGARRLSELFTQACKQGEAERWGRDAILEYAQNVVQPRVLERLKHAAMLGRIEPFMMTAGDFGEGLDDGKPYQEPSKEEDAVYRALDLLLSQNVAEEEEWAEEPDADNDLELDDIEDEEPEDDEPDEEDDEDEDADGAEKKANDIIEGIIQQSQNHTVKVEILQPSERPHEELATMVGCKGIKEHMEEMVALSRYNQMLSEMNPGCRQHELSMHSIFFGGPGTGKTTICKIFGSLLKEAGMLSKGHVVVCDRATFIGNSWGDEERATKQVVEMAQGGVLMIDEAYQLNSDNRNDPGKMVLPLLMGLLADEKQRDIAVVLCGYKKEMKRLLETNPGLNSRFPNQFDFPDFTLAELLEITRRRVHGYNYEFTRAAWTKYKSLLSEAYRVRDPQTWGNARFVANLLERIYLSHARRCVRRRPADRHQLLTITPADIQPIDVPREKPRIGF